MRTWRVLYLVAVFVGIPALIYVTYTRPYWEGYDVDTSVENASRIRPGMTMAEAEAIIGGPPGDYRIRGGHVENFMSGPPPKEQEWFTGNGRVRVNYGYWHPLDLPEKPWREEKVRFVTQTADPGSVDPITPAIVLVMGSVASALLWRWRFGSFQ